MKHWAKNKWKQTLKFESRNRVWQQWEGEELRQRQRACFVKSAVPPPPPLSSTQLPPPPPSPIHHAITYYLLAIINILILIIIIIVLTVLTLASWNVFTAQDERVVAFQDINPAAFRFYFLTIFTSVLYEILYYYNMRNILSF